jgi:hypothetical protein
MTAPAQLTAAEVSVIGDMVTDQDGALARLSALLHDQPDPLVASDRFFKTDDRGRQPEAAEAVDEVEDEGIVASGEDVLEGVGIANRAPTPELRISAVATARDPGVRRYAAGLPGTGPRVSARTELC